MPVLGHATLTGGVHICEVSNNIQLLWPVSCVLRSRQAKLPALSCFLLHNTYLLKAPVGQGSQ